MIVHTCVRQESPGSSSSGTKVPARSDSVIGLPIVRLARSKAGCGVGEVMIAIRLVTVPKSLRLLRSEEDHGERTA